MQLEVWLKQDYQPCIRPVRQRRSCHCSRTISWSAERTSTLLIRWYLPFLVVAWATKRLAPVRSCTSTISTFQQKASPRFCENPGGSSCKEGLEKTERQEVRGSLAGLQQLWVADLPSTRVKVRFQCEPLSSATAGFIKSKSWQFTSKHCLLHQSFCVSKLLAVRISVRLVEGLVVQGRKDWCRINSDSAASVRQENPPSHNFKPSVKLWLSSNLVPVKGSHVHNCCLLPTRLLHMFPQRCCAVQAKSPVGIVTFK